MPAATPLPSDAAVKESVHAPNVPYSRRNLLRAAGGFGLWVGGLLPLFFGLAGCTFADLFHLPCPGCGMTRSGLRLLQGDVGGSLRMNPMTVPATLSQVALVMVLVWLTARDGSPVNLWHNRSGRSVLYALVVTFLIALCVWIARFFGCLGGPVPV